MIDKMIITIVSGILVIILAAQLLLCSLPLFRRLEYDAICQKYVLEMDRAGGLADQTAARLVQDLSERGFTVIQLHGSESAAFGEELALYVVSRFTWHRFNPDFRLEEVSLSLTFQSSTVCRILRNFEEAP